MSDENQKYKVQNLVGVPTDYSDENNWAHLPENADKDVDTFFIYPTLYFNPNPTAPAIVPVDDSNLRAAVKFHYIQAPILFEDMTNVQRREQRTDVYAALDYFFENYNDGRPFILAGHSRGSEMIMLALCDYFKEHTEYLERMVAAYAIGFSITSDDLKINPALKFAEGADDTGVIVS